MDSDSLQMIWPGGGSVAVFVAIVMAVSAMLVLAVRRAFIEEEKGTGTALANRWAMVAAAAIAVLLAGTAMAARAGMFARMVGKPALLAYPLAVNALVLLVAFSPLGRRLAGLPLGALVLFHAFRLPLELVLHAWYTAGAVPVQMTYSGQNLDLVTGAASLLVGAVALRRPATARPLVWAFNVLGTALLLNVMRIVVGSLPSPLRTFTDAPPLMLPFAAPFTWIVPLAIGPALLGHIVLFRALLSPGRDVRSHSVVAGARRGQLPVQITSK